MAKSGGFGQLPIGQHEFGAGQSTIGPRFDTSSPRDESRGVPRTRQPLFTQIYYYSSFPNINDPTVTAEPWVQISEDGGATYLDASAAPYFLTVYQFGLGGHTVRYKIVKDGLWPVRGEVRIQTTLPDEFGQAITKTETARWPDPS